VARRVAGRARRACGPAGEAATRFRESLRFYRAAPQVLDEALIALIMLRTLGPDDRDAVAAAANARQIFERIGARPFLAQLDACSAGPVKRARASAASPTDSPAPTSGS